MESISSITITFCISRAEMTHKAIPKATRDELGITDNLVRLSIGVESVQDLKDDLDQALRKGLGL